MKKTPGQEKPKCGLCGKSKKLMKTECCDQWICDDEDKYVMFSYARNSCSRNHSRYTLCAAHHLENHSGKWQDCKECREGCEPEMVIYYGTNEYNFEKLQNLPEYTPTLCSGCSKVIKLGTDGYTVRGDEHWCMKCKPFPT
jgi:hypothetical protein